MTTAELKKNFHDLIDNINNEKILINFYEIIKERIELTAGTLWKMLSKSELEELTMAIEESYNPQNLISNKEMINKHRQWL